jgi:hypothetical protein
VITTKPTTIMKMIVRELRGRGVAAKGATAASLWMAIRKSVLLIN